MAYLVAQCIYTHSTSCEIIIGISL